MLPHAGMPWQCAGCLQRISLHCESQGVRSWCVRGVLGKKCKEQGKCVRSSCVWLTNDRCCSLTGFAPLMLSVCPRSIVPVPQDSMWSLLTDRYRPPLASHTQAKVKFLAAPSGSYRPQHSTAQQGMEYVSKDLREGASVRETVLCIQHSSFCTSQRVCSSMWW